MAESKVEKRNRPPKSCEPCRLRKLKCNREQPCDACTRRDKAAFCQYAANADRSERRDAVVRSGGGGGSSSHSVTGRLRRLEDMILQMAGGSSGKAFDVQTPWQRSPHDMPRYLDDGAVDVSMSGGDSVDNSVNTPLSDELQVPVDSGNPVTAETSITESSERPSLGGGQLDIGHTTYIDASHWSSLLEEIKELREQLSSPVERDQQPESLASLSLTNSSPSMHTDTAQPTLETPDDSYADLVFAQPSVGPEELLKSLPPRAVCDRLISHYFRVGHSVLPILHPIEFQKEYATFWEAPIQAPPLWIALLFSVLAVSAGLHLMAHTGSNDVDTDTPSPDAMADKARQNLVLGHYADVDAHSLEAMILLLQSHYFYVADYRPRGAATASNVWYLIGMVIRLAVRRGYHRDPSKLQAARLSPFAGEMRRRIWVAIVQVDALTSFQVGLPSMIPMADCDTALPRNLEFTDLRPDMTELPPSRPVSDNTTILYTIVKSSVMACFQAVVAHTRSLAPRPHEDTRALDARLRRAYAELPAHFQYRPLAASLIDSPPIIMSRMTIEMLYLKSLIVLHRNYIPQYYKQSSSSSTTMSTTSFVSTSRQACLDAACTVLDCQAELTAATQHGGILHDARWMISALTVNDFILAAIVLCLDMTLASKHTQRTDDGHNRRLAALRTAHAIWVAPSAQFPEARIAADALGATLARVEARQVPQMDVPAADSQFVSVDALTTDNVDGLDFINWTFLDNNCHDPLNEDLDLNTWMTDATKASGFMDPF
ncbi:hypothetical protein SPBR_06634 [Sporothrix brasiliensis 5110]|uniref:Zn(2)-C6 fungal-type domain-containing protein n=1 Tax=Sporothrix brasiliensis 5110 TaxID=1398154 RepID=A0A0C2IUP5_9PEZI|nr:uncharacterized protein SPBR_06634 [Sporothrix brasiliensis 5110]KIH88702.1 hypothetical protein SPBR_06634 [Sporothrix brasiliensis 5110]